MGDKRYSKEDLIRMVDEAAKEIADGKTVPLNFEELNARTFVH